VDVTSDPNDDHSVLVRPASGSSFFADTRHRVTLHPGLVANEFDHYALHDVEVFFTTGPASNPFFAAPGAAAVVEVDRASWTGVNSTSTPGGRPPVGVSGSHLFGDPLVWVQLASGGGTGASLAWFAPGAGAMTAVTLTPAAGSDLVAEASAMALSRDGRTLYAAFRDDVPGTVRVCRIDVPTRTEILPSLVLSPAASAGTAPLGMVRTADGKTLHVACRTGGTARMVEVDLESFTETDVGPDAGTDGAPMSLGAGPAARVRDLALAAASPAATGDLTAVRRTTGTVYERPSTQVGTPTTLLATPDGDWVLEGLDGYAMGEGLVQRPGADLRMDTALSISDDVGLGPTGATGVRVLATLPGEHVFLAVLDVDVLALFAWDTTTVEQTDLDAVTPGVQAIDLSPAVTGPTAVGFVPGVFAP
jgi:hypothetical protein